jgi:fluoride exporter
MPTLWPTYLWIAAGGALGSVARYWLSGAVARQFETFPMGTLLVNISGSFAIGFFATLTSPEGRWLAPTGFRQFFIYGVCGGYTTFSSFSWQTLELAQDGEWLHAGGNIAASVVLCLTAVWLGHVLAAALNSLKGS